MEKEDSILGEVIELENNLEVGDDWFNETSQNVFGSEFGQELRRLSLQPQKSCNECKKEKLKVTNLKNQYDQLVVRSNKSLKAAEGQKTFLRKQFRLAETEIEENREKWANDVESLTDEIVKMKADDADKRTKSNQKKELEQYKKLLAEKVRENLELTNRLDTVNSLAEIEKQKSDENNKETHEKQDKEEVKGSNEDVVMINIKCKSCRFVAKSFLELRGHAKFVHLTCKFCNEFCATSDKMDKHMKEFHPKEYRPACDDCKMMFPNSNTLEAHIRKKHVKNYLCQVCNKKFEHKSDMMRHMKDIHTEKQTEQFPENKKIGCMICDYKDDTEEKIVKHLADIHNLVDKTHNDKMNVVKCPICEYSSDTDEKVVKHLENVHNLVDEATANKVNKPCRYFKQNRCFKGPECKFVHEENKDKIEGQLKECKNGISCKFLKQNRCDFFHVIAAQPKHQSIHKPSNQDISHLRPTSGHVQQFHASPNRVNMCRDCDKCSRGRSCRFRHYSPAHYQLDFRQLSSNGRK